MDQIKTHHLFEVSGNKMARLVLSDNQLTVETGTSEKLKSTEKSFSKPEDALKEFIKKEWELLKKDYVVKNDTAQNGEPLLHFFVGGGYTGCLSFQHTSKGIYTYKNSADNDYLLLIDENGNRTNEIAMPQRLPWHMAYKPAINSLLLDLDHFIFEYNIDQDKFHQLAERGSGWASFVAVAKEKQAFAANNTLQITDQQNNVQISRPFEAEIVSGSNRFCAQLSDSGTILALHTRTGEIQLINTSDGSVISTLKGDFKKIDQMAFADNDRLLATLEQYASSGVRYFDLTTNEEIKINELDVPAYTKEVNTFCLNIDKTKLVLIQRNWAYVFDFIEKKLLHQFKIDHMVKTVNPGFVGEKLGIRTDYGCFSLYSI
jgi:glutamine cyclotransferase